MLSAKANQGHHYSLWLGCWGQWWSIIIIIIIIIIVIIVIVIIISSIIITIIIIIIIIIGGLWVQGGDEALNEGNCRKLSCSSEHQ